MHRPLTFLLLATVLWLTLFASTFALSANKQTVRPPDMVRLSDWGGDFRYWWDRTSDTCYVVGIIGASSSSAVMAWAPHAACEAQP